MAATPTSNRICASHTTCLTGQYEYSPAGTHKDRQCASIANCDFAIEWEQTPPTETSNRVCAPQLFCDYRVQFEVTKPTKTSNRVCKDLAQCDPETEWISTAASHTSDRACTALTTCDYGTQFDKVVSTSTSDRECAALTTCDMTLQYISTIATPSSDRKCSQLTACASYQQLVQEHTAHSDRQCVTICPAGQYQTRAWISNTENALCSQCPDGTHKPLAGNEEECKPCDDGWKSSGDRLSCFPYKCSHIYCRMENHNCANQKIFSHTDTGHKSGKNPSVYMPNHSFNPKASCAGHLTHRSIRVFHGHCHAQNGCQETVCTHGHLCGMGFLTGDKSKCECKPPGVETGEGIFNLSVTKMAAAVQARESKKAVGAAASGVDAHAYGTRNPWVPVTHSSN